MGVKGNKSDEKVIAIKEMYQGLLPLQVIEFNPPPKRVKELVSRDVEDSRYITEREDELGKYKTLRLDIYCISPKLELVNGNPYIIDFSFFIDNRPWESKKTGKYQFINKYGVTAWDEKENPTFEKCKWFQPENYRLSYRQEESFVNWLKVWANVKETREERQECILENIDAMVNKGDVSELQDLLKMYKDNTFVALLGVKDGKYQTVYSRHFARTYEHGTGSWERHFKKSPEFNVFDPDWGNDYTFRKYTGPSFLKEPVPTESENQVKKIDLPF